MGFFRSFILFRVAFIINDFLSSISSIFRLIAVNLDYVHKCLECAVVRQRAMDSSDSLFTSRFGIEVIFRNTQRWIALWAHEVAANRKREIFDNKLFFFVRENTQMTADTSDVRLCQLSGH